MKLLLDESLPRRLKNELSQHEVTTVPEMGWAGKTNGELLELAAGTFDAFITEIRGSSISRTWPMSRSPWLSFEHGRTGSPI